MLEGKAATQRGLGRLEKQADRNAMKFIKNKFKFFNLRWHKSMQLSRLEVNCLDS